MSPNLPVLVAAALIPFFITFIWFHPKVFGGATWAQAASLSEEQANKKVKPIKLALSILLNFLIAFGLFSYSVHQFSMLGMVGGDAALLQSGTGAAFLAEYGHRHLTFGHGATHGFIAAIVFVLPILGYATIFERKSAKYLGINFFYWVISLMLMGGVVCQWGAVSL